MTKPFKITFCGDTSLGYYYLEKGKNKYSEAYQRLQNDPFSFFEGIAPLLEGSDEIIINLETVLTKNPGEPIEGKEYPGCDDPSVTVDVLKKLGATAVTLANNHAMDFGEEKLVEMIDLLHANGIATIGAGRNSEEARKPYVIILPENGQKVYVLNGMRARKRYIEYGFFAKENKPGIASTNMRAIKKSIDDIRKLDSKAQIVVIPHWQGIDYKDVGEAQQQWCEEVLNYGANLVIGHGSHKRDRVVKVGGKLAYLSIGNFVFNSPGRYAAKEAEPLSMIAAYYPETGRSECVSINTDNKANGFSSYPVGSFDDLSDNLSAELDKPNVYSSNRFSTSLLLKEALVKYGWESEVYGKFLIARNGNEEVGFLETETTRTSLVAYRILKDKGVAREFFKRKGLLVANGEVFEPSDKEAARAYMSPDNLYVVKPVGGNKGRGVSVGVSLNDFDVAWDSAVKGASKIIVEEMFSGGEEVRYLVVGGKCVASLRRSPPFVIGDGVSTINELVKNKNNIREMNPNLRTKLIKMDKYRLKILENKGFSLEYVLPAGQFLPIDQKAGLSTGADSVDITDKVHPKMLEIAEAVANSVPGIDVLGVDIIARDHFKDSSNDYIVVEANTRPGIGGHHFPMYGKPRNVADLIVRHVCNITT